MAVVGINHDTTLVTHNIVVVITIERTGELRLQTRVTHGDVKRIRVVGDIEQLGHLRLTGIATVVQPQVALIAELIVEIECRRKVGYITHGIYIHTTVVLDKVRVLGLNQETDVVIVLLDTVAQVQAHVVGIVLILGIAAQVALQVIVELIVHTVQPGIPGAVLGGDALEDVRRHVTEVVSQTVALILVIAQLVAELQVGTFPQGLAVGCTQHIAPVIGRRGAVTGSIVGRIVTILILLAEQQHLVVGYALVLAIASTTLNTQNDVTTARIQAAIQLQHGPGILVLAIRQVGIQVLVNGIGLEHRELVERVGGIQIRVGIVGGSLRLCSAIAGAIATVGTYQDVSKTVGLPLKAQVTPPVIATGIVGRKGVREGAAFAVKILLGILGLVVATTVVPTHAGINLELIVIIKVEVGA